MTQQNTTARGYGHAHQKERQRWAKLVEQGHAVCTRCLNPIAPDDTWHLDHTEDRTGYQGAAHAKCNVSRKTAAQIHTIREW